MKFVKIDGRKNNYSKQPITLAFTCELKHKSLYN